MQASYHVLPKSLPPFFVPMKYKDWTLVKGEGKGEFSGSLGIVKKFNSPDGTSSIAIKKCTGVFQSIVRAKLVLRQLNLLRTVKHENIVRLIGSYSIVDGQTNGVSIYHITEYCGGPLSERIIMGDYTMDLVKKWTREMLKAVQNLHSNGVIHRNLHPGNICIDANNKLTLIGFGRARVIDRSILMTKEIGTEPYSAIELIVGWVGAYDEKVDIWSIAALLCDLLTGQSLFGGKDAKNSLKEQMKYLGRIDDDVLNTKIQPQYRHGLASCNTERKDLIKILCEEKMLPKRDVGVEDIIEHQVHLKHFLENTLQFDPDRRMSAERALSHSFLLTPQPWERQLPDDEKQAMEDLRKYIDQEIKLAPVP